MRRALLCSLLFAPLVASAAIRSQPVEWNVDDTAFSGFLVYDDAGDKRPGLLMVPNWMGVTDAAVERAKAVAADGYVVLVADVYGRDVRPTNPEQARAAAHASYADVPRLRRRAAAALDVLKNNAAGAPLDANRLGAIGFCFGGATVLELARSGAAIAGVVSFHGSLDTSLPAEQGAVKASVLVLNGADDKNVTPEQIAGLQSEMTAAGADWQFVNYAGAVHCFAEPAANSPPNCMYHERSAKRAYRAMNDFFGERFGE